MEGCSALVVYLVVYSAEFLAEPRAHLKMQHTRADFIPTSGNTRDGT